MRPGALVPALVFGAALLAPPLAEAERHRSPERGRRSGYEHSNRGHGRYERDRAGRSYGRGHSRHSYKRGRPWHKRGHYRPARRHHRPHYRPRRPVHHRRYYAYPPHPRRYYAPWPAPYAHPGPVYGPWPPYRGGVHGSVSIGLPFVGVSLYF